MSPTEKVLRQLQNVQGSGDRQQYQACCPAHEDSVASLSISVGSEGQVLLYCHAGCETEDIVHKIGLEMRDLFPRKTAERKIVETYGFTDEHGDLLFEEVRYEPKDFRLRRPGPDGSWIWKLDGVQRVLYRLPEVLKAARAGSLVFVVEGPKDAEALGNLGFVATTCPQGAGQWKSEYSTALSGADVVVVPDNDEPGRKHARAVADSVFKVASSVRILELPNADKKGFDVSDWIARGNDAHDLLELVHQTVRLHCPPKSEKKRPKVGVRVSEVEPQEVDWLWEGRLAIGEITILDGDPGIGKSTLLAGLTARITTGRPLTRYEHGRVRTRPAGVVLVTTEDSVDHTIRPRLEAAGADLNRVQVVSTVPSLDEDGPDRIPIIPQDLKLLGYAIEDVSARLLIIDPLMAHLGSINSYKDQDVRAALAPLSDFASEHGVSVVLVRHLNKSEGRNPLYRGGGSIGIMGAARVGLLMGRHPSNEDTLVLTHVKNNLSCPAPSLACHLEDAGGVARVVWDGVSNVTAADLLNNADGPGRKPTSRNQAKKFLYRQLRDEPRLACDLLSEATEEGICERTLDRAAKELEVRKEKIGFQGPSQWSLPKRPDYPA